MIVLLRRVALGFVAVASLVLAGCSNVGASCVRPSDCAGSETCVLQAGNASLCAKLCTPDAGSGCGSGEVCQPLPEVGCDAGTACGATTVCR